MLWELAAQRDCIEQFPKEAIDAVVHNVRDVSMRTRWFACAAAWALAPVQAMRRHMAGGLRTSTRPPLKLLVLLRAGLVYVSIHPEGMSCEHI
jgi:hypothetical protein